MSRGPAPCTQADIARAIRAAKQEGATEVEVHLPTGAFFVIRVASGGTPPLVPSEDIVL